MAFTPPSLDEIETEPFSPPSLDEIEPEALPVPEPLEDSGKGRLRSAGSSFMRGGGVGIGQALQGAARATTSPLQIVPGMTMPADASPETRAAFEAANRRNLEFGATPEGRTANALAYQKLLEEHPAYTKGGEIVEGAREAFQPNPKFQGEFFSDVIPSSAGQMVPTIASGIVAGPVGAAAQYGLSSGQSGAEESIKAGDIEDADKVFMANLGLGAASEFLLGAPAYVLRYLRAIRATGMPKEVAKQGLLRVMGRAGIREAGQESLEQVGQNITAQQTFDHERPLMQNVPESAAAGLLLGGVVGGAGQRVGESRRKFTPPALDEIETPATPTLGTGIEAALAEPAAPEAGITQDTTLTKPVELPVEPAAERINEQQLEINPTIEKGRAEPAAPVQLRVESERPVGDRETSKKVASETGWTPGERQIGGIKLDTLPPETLAALKEKMPVQVEFTDRRVGSPSEGFTVYAPENATAAEIKTLIEGKTKEISSGTIRGEPESPGRVPSPNESRAAEGPQETAARISESSVKFEPVDKSESNKEGFDVEDGWPIKKASVEGSKIYFEEGDKAINVLSIGTDPQFRRQGKATGLIEWLKNHAGEKPINWGSYTEMGEAYLKPVVERPKLSTPETKTGAAIQEPKAVNRFRPIPPGMGEETLPPSVEDVRETRRREAAAEGPRKVVGAGALNSGIETIQAKTEKETLEQANEILAKHGTDYEAAWGEIKNLGDDYLRATAQGALMARVAEAYSKEDGGYSKLSSLMVRMGDQYAREASNAGQNLQARKQGNRLTEPFSGLYAWLGVMRKRVDAATEGAFDGAKGEAVIKAVKEARQAARKAAKDKSKVFRQELGKILKSIGVEPKHSKKVIRASEKLITKDAAGELDMETLREVLAEQYGLESVNGPTAKKLVNLAMRLRSAPEGLPRYRIEKEITQVITDARGLNLTELIQDYWFASVLLRMGTWVNVAVGSGPGSAMFTGAALTDRILTGNPAQAFRVLQQYLAGVKEAVIVAAEFAATGKDELLPDAPRRFRKAIEGKGHENALETLRRQGGVAGNTLGSMVVSRRMITALDYLFAIPARDALVLFSAYVRKNPRSIELLSKKWNKEASAQAEQQAKDELGDVASRGDIIVQKRHILERGVEQDVLDQAEYLSRRIAANADPKGLAGALYDAANQFFNSLGAGGFYAKAILNSAFLRAGLNMAQNAADIYPGLGAARIAIGAIAANRVQKLGNGAGKWENWASSPEERRIQIQLQTAGLVATAALAAFFLSGEDDDDRKLRINGGWVGLTPQQAKDLRNKKEIPYSFRIRNKDGTFTSVSYRNTPLMPLLAAIGYLTDRKRFKGEKFDADGVANSVFAAWSSGIFAIRDISAISGIAGILNANAGRTDDPENLTASINRAIAGTAGRFAGGFIPSVSKEVDEILDPQLYRDADKKKLLGYWLRSIPFARRTVGSGPELDILGDPIEQVRPPLRQYLSSERSNDKAWVALGWALENGVFPPYVTDNNTVTEGGEKRDMTEEESLRYKIEFGRRMREVLEDNSADILLMKGDELKEWFHDAKWNKMKTQARKEVIR